MLKNKPDYFFTPNSTIYLKSPKLRILRRMGTLSKDYRTWDICHTSAGIRKSKKIIENSLGKFNVDCYNFHHGLDKKAHDKKGFNSEGYDRDGHRKIG